MNYPDALTPTTEQEIYLAKHGLVKVQKATPVFRKWTGEPPSDTYNKKAVLDYEGEMVFAELAILRIFERAGWDGRWIDTYRNRNLTAYWPEKVSKALPDAQQQIISCIRQQANAKGGCFDVLCWNDSQTVFVESKRQDRDRIRASQRVWLDAALTIGIALESFLIVEWALAE